MKLSVEILDHIFSFLVSYRTTLLACSQDPVLSPIVERHLYHHIYVFIETPPRRRCYSDEFEPDRLSHFVSENPRILYFVRILEISVTFHEHYEKEEPEIIKMILDEFAETLRLFPSLECLIIATSKKRTCYFPDIFRAALEDRLRLPTIKELRLTGNIDFPFSLLDDCKSIKHLALSLQGSFATNDKFGVSTLPQLESLSLGNSFMSPSDEDWVKHHITELRSLKCRLSSRNLELLDVCWRTLKKLDIDLVYTSYFSTYTCPTGETDFSELPAFVIPPNLEQLTIHATVSATRDAPIERKSYLPAAVKIIKLFRNSSLHVIFDLDIGIYRNLSNLAEIDFSPLASLGAASLSIPRIDLYVHTDNFSCDVTLSRLLSLLADYEEVMRSIEEGKIIIHSEKQAPAYAKNNR